MLEQPILTEPEITAPQASECGQRISEDGRLLVSRRSWIIRVLTLLGLFSILVRKVLLEQCRLSLGTKISGTGRTLGEELLQPTLIYVKPLLDIIRRFRVHGMAHITGGGLIGNIPRILPPQCRALIKKKSWSEPPIFSFLREKSGIAEIEMLKTFNCGIGMVLVVPRRDADAVTARLGSYRLTAYIIGEITGRPKGGTPIVIV